MRRLWCNHIGLMHICFFPQIFFNVYSSIIIPSSVDETASVSQYRFNFLELAVFKSSPSHSSMFSLLLHCWYHEPATPAFRLTFFLRVSFLPLEKSYYLVCFPRRKTTNSNVDNLQIWSQFIVDVSWWRWQQTINIIKYAGCTKTLMERFQYEFIK